MPSTEEIISLLQAKDEKGLKILYENYSGALYGIVFRVLNHRQHAENALQNCFMKVWQNIDKYDSKKASLFTWMSQIARNAAIDIRRLKAFENEQRTDSISQNVSNSSYVKMGSEKIDTEKLLKGLDEKYRFVLEHLYLKGYSQRDLAEKFDIPLGTIKTRLRGALKQIRENLKDEKHLFLGFFLLILIIIITLT